LRYRPAVHRRAARWPLLEPEYSVQFRVTNIPVYWLDICIKAAAPSFAVEAIVAPARDVSELESVIAAQARRTVA